ncbi:ribosome biogenesis protein [Thermoplasma sp. Kam2015]|uniref:DUF367 family protein n=1 Tax=Thermoplasma sp. Kam2015 TaxID=2094122 RepID=UPI000D90ACB2|nr:DUF367 family protein [Thermoplasma sp. Kam2015]PYB69149.1 ribosome biogenesis protein [Thermoplasma sp. Kam2015]
MIPIYFIYLKQDDPKKSTMRKLERFGLARRISYGNTGYKLVLTPFTDVRISKMDRPAAERHGICVIEGSWNREETFRHMQFLNARRLPKLLAANPVNYGKLERLSSIEAVAAALYIIGHKDDAFAILSKYNWGMNFIQLNRNPLDEYSEAEPEKIPEIEDAYF